MFQIFTLIAFQVSVALFMLLHDWVHLPALTDIRELEKLHSVQDRIMTTLMNAFFALVPLGFTFFYRASLSWWVLSLNCFFYGVLLLGATLAWSVPYLFGHKNFEWFKKLYGTMKQHKEGFIEYQNTHHLLPNYKNNLVPNTLHLFLHIQIFLCFVISFSLFF